MNFVNKGVKVRWLNNAGFEFVMANGKHLLVDPLFDEDCMSDPVSLDSLERADYILLSHLHGDHADSVGRIEKKFPKVKILVGDLSADALCAWQNVNLNNLYRVRGGEVYDFGDVKIQAISGRHTEAPRGTYRSDMGKMHMDKPNFTAEAAYAGWLGSLELHSFLITLEDGMRILIWAGMPTIEQANRLRGLNPELAFMHISSKLVFDDFAQLVKSVNARIVIPHHCDGDENFLRMRAENMRKRGGEFVKYIDANGLFDTAKYMETIDEAIKKVAPSAGLHLLDHHRWYQFGLAMDPQGF